MIKKKEIKNLPENKMEKVEFKEKWNSELREDFFYSNLSMQGLLVLWLFTFGVCLADSFFLDFNSSFIHKRNYMNLNITLVISN